MVETQDFKLVALTPPGAIVDDASYTTSSVDTKGWDRLDIYVLLGATDIAMAALKVQTSDTDGSYADLSGATYDGGTQIDGTTAALPSATADNTFRHFGIDLKGKKRFFDLVATAGNGSTGTYMTAFAVLSRGESSPDTYAKRGLGGSIQV